MPLRVSSLPDYPTQLFNLYVVSRLALIRGGSRLMHRTLETRINILVSVYMAIILGTTEAWSKES
jgi:hypothetical protein